MEQRQRSNKQFQFSRPILVITFTSVRRRCSNSPDKAEELFNNWWWCRRISLRRWRGEYNRERQRINEKLLANGNEINFQFQSHSSHSGYGQASMPSYSCECYARSFKLYYWTRSVVVCMVIIWIIRSPFTIHWSNKLNAAKCADRERRDKRNGGGVNRGFNEPFV